MGVKLQELDLEEIIKNTELISIYIKVMMMVNISVDTSFNKGFSIGEK